MTPVLVDSNVILDIVTEDPTWYDWSAKQLAAVASQTELVINAIIYTEVSVGFERIEDLDDVLATEVFRREALPYEAGFLAGKAFVRYRRRGGHRVAPLPDLFIGAHAAVAGYALLTRDATRYRSYYPRLRLIAPK